MRFKNRAGFLLLEALLAIAIVGLMLVPALSLLTSTLNRVNEHLWDFRRLFFAQQFMSEIQRKLQEDTKKLVETKKVQKPETELTYRFERVSDKSVLHDFDGIYKEEVEAQDRRKQVEISLIQFVYKAPEKEEKKP